MQLDIESLRVLLAVLDHGGMTRAAERLHLGQSAVSRKIQRLEDRVGRPLLIRDGHSFRPTRDGRALIEDARSMVALHDRSVARLKSSEIEGRVRLSCNGEIDTTQIASLLGAFKRRHPGAHVEFKIDHTGALVEHIDDGEIDVAMFQVTDEMLRSTDIKLWTEDLVWVTSASDPFQEPPVPFIDFGEHCYYNGFTHAIFNSAGLVFDTVFSAASSIDVRSAVESGIGVAVMSRRYLGGEVVEWRPPYDLDPLPHVSQIVRTVPGERHEAVAALIDTVQNELTVGRNFA